jgi:peptidoglycan hydrolase-like protein with peptidoglycan-binding domain
LALRSRLFLGDSNLEAAASSDAAHITRGAQGPHVQKIQTALNLLDRAGLDTDGAYGDLTAAAVLSYKRARRIINTARQTQADDIVGRMTITTLDSELLLAERPKGPIRIEPVYPGPPPSRPSRFGSSGLIAFKLNDFPNIGGPAISSSQFDLTPSGSTRFKVTGGANCTVDTGDHAIALVFDPAIPNAHGGKFSVTRDPHEFELRAGMTLGSTTVVAQRKGQSIPFGFDSAFASVLVSRALPRREVTIAFNFVIGPGLIGTKRSDDRTLDAAVRTMNEVYNAQTHIIFQRVKGSRFTVPDLESRDPKVGVVLAKGRRTDDWNKIASHRTSGALMNVFFVGTISMADTPFSDSAVGLSQKFGTSTFVARDMFLQDNLRGNPFELTVAHESGHSLGADNNTIDGNLMREAAPGRSITEQDATIMNKSLASAPP